MGTVYLISLDISGLINIAPLGSSTSISTYTALFTDMDMDVDTMVFPVPPLPDAIAIFI